MATYRSSRIARPGGGEIEIIYLAEVAASIEAGRAPELAAALGVSESVGGELWHCPRCRGDLVHPVATRICADGAWWVDRRCPACEWRGQGVHTAAAAERFRDAHEDGTDELATTARAMARLNMSDDIDRLVAAIRRGLIEPMDF